MTGVSLTSVKFSFLISVSLLYIIVVTVSSLASAQANPSENSGASLSNKSNREQIALNYLLFSSSKSSIKSDQKERADLEELLKDSNHNHVGDKVSLDLANRVWFKMRTNALEYAQQRANESRPAIEQFLHQSGVSAACRQSLFGVLEHLARLDLWAVQMYNSFGDFPATGLFEGSLTSMGSYHQCVNLEPNQIIGDAQYCTFKLQPIVPKRPKYHNILAPIEGLANFTNKDDMFSLLAKKSQYFYYTKLNLATCMPSKCEQNDLELLGMQVAKNSYLQFSGVSCFEKQEASWPDGAQIFALSILIILGMVSVLGTLVDILDLKNVIVTRSAPAAARATEFDAPNAVDAGLFPNSKNQTHQHQHQHQLQQQQQQNITLLPSSQQKSSILAQPVVIQHSSGESIGECKWLSLIEVLLQFSLIRNGRKLFDTSTSRRRDSDAPGIKLPCRTSGSSNSSFETSSEPDECPSGGRASDISCVHGLRFWTITWIIFGHTMQYTEWAGFARAYQVENHIVSFYLHPILNATFSVDTFFLISGLLTTYVTWSITRGSYRRFNKFAFLISRYLRLTPQVLLVILLFILFPLMGDGPYWRSRIQKESDNCRANWWVNALYLQAFVKKDNICNLVTWWLSIEMFYHFVSIFAIIALLKSTRKGVYTTVTIGAALTAVSCYLHYSNGYPPNMLPTILQRYEVWDDLVLKFFWTPYPHASSYFVGLLLGYILYSKRVSFLSKAQIKYGWFAFAGVYLGVLFGTYGWNNNAAYSRFTAAAYYNATQLLWSLATGWCILACALGHGGWLNRFLSSPVFVPLGRATYMTYLSHMLIVLSYPAKMNLLIEPSYIVFTYIFIANLFLSYAFGIVLTLVYESPILHLQKELVTSMAMKFNEEAPNSSKISDNEKVVRVSLCSHQQDSATNQNVPNSAC